MSVSGDLARNRRVFEILTGTSAEPEDSEAGGDTRRPLAAPVWESTESSQKIAQDFVPSGNTNVRRFSLTYGVKSETGMALGFEAPGPVGFPELRGTPPEPVPDPLEDFYDRLEADARMSSQLSGEEEF